MSDLRDRLETTRDQLAEAMAAATPGQLSPLAREYRATLAALEQLPSETVKSTLDELKDRRASRSAGAKDSARPRRGRQVGG